jgi:hypothetical protein
MPGTITFEAWFNHNADTRTARPNLRETVRLGPEAPIVTGGYGGWDMVERPRRVAMTQWNGREPIQMDVPIVFDGFKRNDGQEINIATLERMALPHGGGEPPKVKIIGSAMPHSDLEWVINGITWGEQIRNRDGLRVRQEGVVSLISYIDVDKVKLSAAKKTRNRKAKERKKKTRKKGR